ncbi:MAG: bifunctional folylpolyglutamate synthase/dihydrofolate synthase [Candidatus Dormibacteria bacterium]
MLDSISWRGIKPGLERTRALLRQLGDPDVGLRGILVAGTNGKGSVCATVESVARAAGLRTVLLTKPHLWSYTERFVADGRQISEEGFAALMGEMFTAAEALPADLEPTAFEMLTAAGILFAARAAPDIVVCEVGVGGRLDSTNVLDLGVAVVTNVDFDHRDLLGDTIEAIAREKAAIIKAGDLAVTAALPPALDEIRARASDVGAQLAVLGVDIPAGGTSRGWDGVRVRTVFDAEPISVNAPLLGDHQVANVATAVVTCDALHALGCAIDSSAVVAGCAAVRWPGRLQWVAGEPGWLVDGAHNGAAMRALVDAVLQLLADRRVVLLFGVLRDKERAPMISELRRMRPAATVITAPEAERALPVEELTSEFPGATVAPDIERAMTAAARLAGREGAVVACGSLYLAGDVLHRLGAL